jgi:UDP-N-acetylmuramoylalanine--D-glutamate ligase
MTDRVLVYGIGVAGMATVRALTRRNIDLIAVDDATEDTRRDELQRLGVDLVEAPSSSTLEDLVSRSTMVAPAPGVPESHPVVAAARRAGRRVVTELDLAYEWESARAGGPRPIVAVTGTDGKTSTTLLTADILTSAGRSTVACGNTEVPMVEALELDVDCFVVEATSFRLAFCDSFRAEASAWLNLAEDHLDWHESMKTYEAAKARLWSHVRANDTAVGWVDDPVVMRHLARTRCRRVTFGLERADYTVADGHLVGPSGEIAPIDVLSRSLPHDVTNALCAAALALESGLADRRAVAAALPDFRAPHHRIELVGEADGVRWYDDSKATTPHAVRTAVRGFENVILVAGGRNKGLDLSEIALEKKHIRAVVAIGDAAPEIVRAFSGIRPVDVANDMGEAVAKARGLATSGDVVLLSPGCTSFDWYDGYARRGEDFSRRVRELIGGRS